MDKEKHMVRKIKLVTSVITTYLFLSILTMLIWIALDPPKPATALSFTLAGSSTWAIGTKGGGQESTSGSPTTWTVTNDTSPAVTENITIQVTGATWTSAASAWTTGTAAGENIYVLTLKSPGDTIMGTTATTLASGLAGGGEKGFGLAFTTPSTSTEQGAHTLTITLTAVAFSPCGVGAYYYNTYCWYISALGQSCTSVCSTHGGFVSGLINNSTRDCNACETLNASVGCTVAQISLPCYSARTYNNSCWSDVYGNPKNCPDASDPIYEVVCPCAN